MKRLATWLGIAAIALQIAWPLLAGAKPRSVTLVPLCTVDGVTHYLEVPAGKAPLDGPASHGDHCPLCLLGERAGLAAPFPLLVFPVGAVQAVPSVARSGYASSYINAHHARAPPVSRVTTFADDIYGRHHEMELLA